VNRTVSPTSQFFDDPVATDYCCSGRQLCRHGFPLVLATAHADRRERQRPPL
jgi:hypothetical protein